MIEVINYLFKPTINSEKIISKEDINKIILVSILLVLQSGFSVLNEYIEISDSTLTFLYFIKLFFYIIVSNLFFTVIIYFIGKIFGGKAKYLDVLLITLVSGIIFIISDILLIILNITGIDIFLLGNSFIFLIAALWFLGIWSKGLSKIFNITETKFAIIAILSILILYFGNSFIYGISGLSIF